jgi:hypothetical protein
MSRNTSALSAPVSPTCARPGRVATLLFFAIAGEFVRMGWYGSAAMSIFTALLTMRWLWLFLAGFSVGRMFRR